MPYRVSGLTLDGDQDAVGRRQCVGHQQAQRRRAVDENVVIVRLHGGQFLLQRFLAAYLPRQLGLGHDQVQTRGYDEKVERGPPYDGIFHA